MYNLLIGGAAGDGIDTMASLLEKTLKRSGYYVFTVRDFMSRVRGGHNFTQIRFGDEPLTSHSDRLDGILAFNEETLEIHLPKLSPDGFILADQSLDTRDSRAVRLDLAAMTKQIGNPKVRGTILAAAALSLFGVNAELASQTLRDSLRPALFEVNQKAMEAGFAALSPRYPMRAGADDGRLLINGNQALALGAIAGGLRFYSAYPMSPSTTIMTYLDDHKQTAGLVVEQAEDEIAAINMAIGASFAGAAAMTGTSGGGFSLMVEALGLSGIAEIPLVAVDVQRPGPATGLPTRTEQSDLKFVISASQGEFPRMVIAVKNQQDAFYQAARALHLAEKYQFPVILLSDQYIADSSSTIPPYDLSGVESVVPGTSEPGTGEYLRYRLTPSGISPRMIPGRSNSVVLADSDEHDERGHITESAQMRTQMMDKRMRKLVGLQAELQEPEFLGEEDFDTLLIGFGSLWGALSEAVQTLNAGEGPRYGALVFGDVYPLPTQRLTQCTGKARRILSVEQNATGQLTALIREQTGIICDDSLLKYDGRQISGEEVAAWLKEGRA